MKNTLTDLNNHLFAQIERLNDEDLSQSQLEFESVRTQNMTSIAKEIISNARLTLDAQVKLNDLPSENIEVPRMLK